MCFSFLDVKEFLPCSEHPLPSIVTPCSYYTSLLSSGPRPHLLQLLEADGEGLLGWSENSTELRSVSHNAQVLPFVLWRWSEWFTCYPSAGGLPCTERPLLSWHLSLATEAERRWRRLPAIERKRRKYSPWRMYCRTVCIHGWQSAGFSPKKKINTVAPSDRMLMRKPDCLTKGKLPLRVVVSPLCAETMGKGLATSLLGCPRITQNPGLMALPS